MSDNDGKKTLGVRSGPRAGNVKQSFSHGRSKNVVVETKRKRIVVPKAGTSKTTIQTSKKEGAKKLYDNFLPFNHSADMWMNEVIRKTNLNVYWSEPSLVTSKFNKKTSTKLTFSQFFYGLKSKSINKKLGI